MHQRPFRFEREMAVPVRRWLEGQSDLVKSEFETPCGICDLVGVQFRRRNVQKRLQLGQNGSMSPTRRIGLFARLPKERGITIATLERSYYGLADSRELVEDLEWLQRRGFVLRVRQGVYRKVDGWLPLHKKIVSVELKLNRIAEAVAQASRNLDFADESYVALPKRVAHRAMRDAKQTRFMDAGVGLLAVSPSGCRVLVRSRDDFTGSSAVAQLKCIEQCWQSYLRLRGSWA